jgi:hypothetical protein
VYKSVSGAQPRSRPRILYSKFARFRAFLSVALRSAWRVQVEETVMPKYWTVLFFGITSRFITSLDCVKSVLCFCALGKDFILQSRWIGSSSASARAVLRIYSLRDRRIGRDDWWEPVFRWGSGSVLRPS